ncbi:MAG: glycosyltransferase family 2 protein [Sediminibacterium sp.]|nr:glycosyltransferase family 2 protein [Sediminibacterium sp.]
MHGNNILNRTFITVDAVITTYNESYDQINITLASCLQQSFPFDTIYIVDDGSKNFSPDKLIPHPSIKIISLPVNKGISAARNTAIKLSSATYIACINVEIELQRDWLELLLSCFCDCYEFPISAAFGKLVVNSKSILSLWRLRFHEQYYPKSSGRAEFAPGHAVLFKSDYLLQVKGYNENLKLVHEDADICFRLKALDTNIYYNSNVSIISHQKDSLDLISRKHLVRMTLGSGKSMRYKDFCKILLRDHFNRFFRNLIKGRWAFFFLDWKISYNCFKLFIE